MLDIFYKRRSTRRFTTEKVQAEKLDRILNAGLLAPSSKGKYPCEFIIIQKEETIIKLSKSKSQGANFLSNAPAAIVICGDIEKSDVWIEDCAIAASFMLTQAEDENIGACWIQIRKRPHDENKSAEEYIQNILGIPANMKVLAILAIGNKDGDKPAREADFLKREKIHYDKF